MDEPIVPIEYFKDRARADFAAGKTMADCPYNWSRHGAYVIYRAEMERLTESQQSHIAPAAVSGIDAGQVSA